MPPFHSFETKVPWALVFVTKILGFVAIIDVAVFPILWILRVALPQAYFPITFYEGFSITVIGVLVLFTSLFSTVEQPDDRYLGHGMYRYGIKFKKLSKEDKHDMRVRGILMILVGMILSVIGSFPFLSVLLAQL